MDQTTQPPAEIESLRESLRVLAGAGYAGTQISEGIINALIAEFDAVQKALKRESLRAEQARKDHEGADAAFKQFSADIQKQATSMQHYEVELKKRIAELEKRIQDLAAMEQRLVTQIAQKQAILAQLET